ncbi:DUF3611 family protein [Tropicimonas sp. IMCC34043]|uniref:DUF3611 family protein n=1 Tax=Tropicimonas sp. IMCC34043 TaxID=2248760 RepID=UPI001300495A|nr:DUF3611 family protein [Tropicimonas sp. IMCC34043]
MLRRFGSIGFWTQIVISVVPVIVITIAFTLAYGVQSPVNSAGFLGLLSLISFLLLLATTYWCWYYSKLGQKLLGGSATTLTKLIKVIWMGLFLTSTGIVLSVVVLLSEMTYLLIRFLEAPQAGVPVIQTAEATASWISAVDILSLMTVVLALTGEIIVLVLSLWMLARIKIQHERAAA